MGYVSQVSLVTPYRSKRTCSFSAQLVAWTAPPSTWFAAPSGLITRPRRPRWSPPDPDLADRLHVGDHGAICAGVLVAGEADTVPSGFGR